MQTRVAYGDWSAAQLREQAAAQLNEARSRLVAVDGLHGPVVHSTSVYDLRTRIDNCLEQLG